MSFCCFNEKYVVERGVVGVLKQRSVPSNTGVNAVSTISGSVAAVVQWVRAFAPQAEGLVFESQPSQTKVVETGSDSFTAKHSAIGASVTGPWR